MALKSGQHTIYIHLLYAGTVMMSFNHVMIIPTRGNWFQTNPLEHELDDRADLLCVFYHWQRYGTSVAI